MLLLVLSVKQLPRSSIIGTSWIVHHSNSWARSRSRSLGSGFVDSDRRRGKGSTGEFLLSTEPLSVSISKDANSDLLDVIHDVSCFEIYGLPSKPIREVEEECYSSLHDSMVSGVCPTRKINHALSPHASDIRSEVSSRACITNRGVQ